MSGDKDTFGNRRRQQRMSAQQVAQAQQQYGQLPQHLKPPGVLKHEENAEKGKASELELNIDGLNVPDGVKERIKNLPKAAQSHLAQQYGRIQSHADKFKYLQQEMPDTKLGTRFNMRTILPQGDVTVLRDRVLGNAEKGIEPILGQESLDKEASYVDQREQLLGRLGEIQDLGQLDDAVNRVGRAGSFFTDLFTGNKDMEKYPLTQKEQTTIQLKDRILQQLMQMRQGRDRLNTGLIQSMTKHPDYAQTQIDPNAGATSIAQKNLDQRIIEHQASETRKDLKRADDAAKKLAADKEKEDKSAAAKLKGFQKDVEKFSKRIEDRKSFDTRIREGGHYLKTIPIHGPEFGFGDAFSSANPALEKIGEWTNHPDWSKNRNFVKTLVAGVVKDEQGSRPSNFDVEWVLGRAGFGSFAKEGVPTRFIKNAYFVMRQDLLNLIASTRPSVRKKAGVNLKKQLHQVEGILKELGWNEQEDKDQELLSYIEQTKEDTKMLFEKGIIDKDGEIIPGREDEFDSYKTGKERSQSLIGNPGSSPASTPQSSPKSSSTEDYNWEF